MVSINLHTSIVKRESKGGEHSLPVEDVSPRHRTRLDDLVRDRLEPAKVIPVIKP